MPDRLKPYLKALIPIVLLVVAVLANMAGVETGIDMEAQIALLVASVAVYATPNESPDR